MPQPDQRNNFRENYDELRIAVERMHGGSTLTQSVPVRETFEGRPVWEGVVHVFDLSGHPTATRAYALVIADQGKQEASIFRGVAYGANQFAARGRASSHCGRTSEGKT